jgi:hypothetical protein
MAISREHKIKIKNFLKVNLETLQGQQLADFSERYDIREAGAAEMMLLDHGCPGQFIAFKKPDCDSYHVTTYDMVEKILFLETLDATSPLKEEILGPVRIN